MFHAANKKELVGDLISKAKQVEVLIKSLPTPESEETHVCFLLNVSRERFLNTSYR